MKVALINLPFPFTPEIERSEGLHVSDIIQSIIADLYNEQYGGITEEVRYRFHMGFLWERMAELAWQDHLGWRPEEIEVDGIALSPDYIHIRNSLVVRELKATWRSSKHPPEENLRWMLQMKAYCYGLQTRYADLYPFYVNGDWKPPVPTFLGVYQFEFTERELEENWNVMLNHAREKGML